MAPVRGSLLACADSRWNGKKQTMLRCLKRPEATPCRWWTLLRSWKKLTMLRYLKRSVATGRPCRWGGSQGTGHMTPADAMEQVTYHFTCRMRITLPSKLHVDDGRSLVAVSLYMESACSCRETSESNKSTETEVLISCGHFTSQDTVQLEQAIKMDFFCKVKLTMKKGPDYIC